MLRAILVFFLCLCGGFSTAAPLRDAVGQEASARLPQMRSPTVLPE
nr:hypothetical protein [Phaeobacter sp. PT47_59]